NNNNDNHNNNDDNNKNNNDNNNNDNINNNNNNSSNNNNKWTANKGGRQHVTFEGGSAGKGPSPGGSAGVLRGFFSQESMPRLCGGCVGGLQWSCPPLFFAEQGQQQG
ncbi:unnamed protein product, partial [Polarella glacialis]